jgi:2Fe-2S ferredoxin
VENPSAGAFEMIRKNLPVHQTNQPHILFKNPQILPLRPFMATVKFLFEDPATPPQTISGDLVDQSILEITEEYDIHLNHNCGGVCACSTCHVYVEQGDAFLEEISEKEEDFIDRAVNPRLESRLGCQCIILDNNAEITITIPDQRRIIGHEH